MTELNFHISLVSMLRLCVPAEIVWFHVPNGGARDKREAAKLKAMGTVPGVPDLSFILPPNGRVAYLELKAPKGVLSNAQKAFRDRVVKAGALWAVAASPEAAIDILLAWNILRSDPLRRAVPRALGAAA